MKPNKKANKAVTYKSSKKKIVSVTKKGKLKALKKGKSKITVTSKFNKKKKAKLTVIVGTPIKKLKLSKSKLTLDINKSKTLKVTYTPKKPSVKKVTWKSSNKKKATVTSKGKVTAKEAGTATITATAADGSNKKAKCKVTVKGTPPTPPPTDDMLLVEDFSGYDVGYNWTQSTMKNTKPEGSSKMTVITDPEEANNKVLEVKPAGYNTVPVKTVKLPVGKTLNDYKGIYIEVRVLEGTDLANKAATAFFDKAGAISDTDTRFMTYDPNTVQGLKDKTAEKAAEGVTTEWANYTDAQLETLAYNNRFFNEVPMASREDDASTDINERFMPSFSETRQKEGKEQEPGYQKGWKNMLLPFEVNNIPDDVLKLNEFDVAVGANYDDQRVGTDEECVWYLNCIYLDPKPDEKVKVTGITISGSDRVRLNGTETLTAKVTPDNATDKSIKWSSENTALATVGEKSGIVTGVAKGKVTIVATAQDGSGVVAKKTIEVFEPVVEDKDYVVDLSKIVTDTDIKGSDADASFENGVLSIDFKKQYANSFFLDLGEEKDLNGYAQYQIIAESNGQLTFDLFEANLKDIKNDDKPNHDPKWYERAKYLDYPFEGGTMTNRTAWDRGAGDAKIPGKETVKNKLTGDLTKIRYIRIDSNKPEAAEGIVKIYEIRFLAPTGEKEKDVLDDLTVDYPLVEDFSGETYKLGWSNWDDETNNYLELTDPEKGVTIGEDEDGTTYASVPKSEYDGIAIPLDNREGTDSLDYYVEATVRTKTGEPEYGKVGLSGGNTLDKVSNYYPGNGMKQYGTDYYVQKIITNDWYTIKAKITVPKESFGETRLKGTAANGFEVKEVKIEVFDNQDLTMEQEAEKPPLVLEGVWPTFEMTDFSQKSGGYGAEYNETTGTWAVGTSTANYQRLVFDLPTTIDSTAYLGITIEGKVDKDFRIAFLDEEGAAVGSTGYPSAFDGKIERTLPAGMIKKIAFENKEEGAVTFKLDKITFHGGFTMTDFSQKSGGYGAEYEETIKTWTVGSATANYQRLVFDLPEIIDSTKYSGITIEGIADKDFRIVFLDEEGAAIGSEVNRSAFDGKIELTLPAGLINKIAFENKDAGAVTFKLDKITFHAAEGEFPTSSN